MSERSHLRIFLSSPEMSKRSAHLFARLIKNETLLDPLSAIRATIEIVSWDDPHARCNGSIHQKEAINQGIGKPSDCGTLFVVLTWEADGARHFHPSTRNRTANG